MYSRCSTVRQKLTPDKVCGFFMRNPLISHTFITAHPALFTIRFCTWFCPPGPQSSIICLISWPASNVPVRGHGLDRMATGLFRIFQLVPCSNSDPFWCGSGARVTVVYTSLLMGWWPCRLKGDAFNWATDSITFALDPVAKPCNCNKRKVATDCHRLDLSYFNYVGASSGQHFGEWLRYIWRRC